MPQLSNIIHIMKGLKTILTVAFFTVCKVAVASTTSNVVDLHPKNFDEVVLKSGKPALVEFFAVGCLRSY